MTTARGCRCRPRRPPSCCPLHVTCAGRDQRGVVRRRFHFWRRDRTVSLHGGDDGRGKEAGADQDVQLCARRRTPTVTGCNSAGSARTQAHPRLDAERPGCTTTRLVAVTADVRPNARRPRRPLQRCLDEPQPGPRPRRTPVRTCKRWRRPLMQCAATPRPSTTCGVDQHGQGQRAAQPTAAVFLGNSASASRRRGQDDACQREAEHLSEAAVNYAPLRVRPLVQQDPRKHRRERPARRRTAAPPCPASATAAVAACTKPQADRQHDGAAADQRNRPRGANARPRNRSGRGPTGRASSRMPRGDGRPVAGPPCRPASSSPRRPGEQQQRGTAGVQ